MEHNRSYRHRPSFFFPFALITVGVVWLLVNNGAVPVENIYRLLPFWPVLIILAGLSLLLRRVWWPVNILIWGGAAALTIWLVTSGSPFLPTLPAIEIKHETLREPLGQARSAKVMLDLSINPAKVSAIAEGNDLLSADVYYTGEMRLETSGQNEKEIRLVHRQEQNDLFFNPRLDQWAELSRKTWSIGLSPDIPINLTVDASTGSAEFDLSQVDLSALNIDASTGSMDLLLPVSRPGYAINLDASTGSINMTLPADTRLEMDVKASTGSLTIDVPDGAAVRVVVTDSGTGSLNLPDAMEKVSGSRDEKEGVYETNDFTSAENAITINIDMSTGSVNLR